MLRSAALVVLALTSACRISLEDNPAPIDGPPVDAAVSASCLEAETRQDVAFLETKVWGLSCTFSGCHDGGADAAGQMDLRAGTSVASLVNVDSQLDPRFKLVVPGQPGQSYLMMMIQQISAADMTPPTTVPADPGLMPLNTGGAPLCAPKRAAVERWIVMGAPAT